MSHVTDIILITASQDKIENLEYGLVNIDRDIPGGNKYMQCGVYMSAMNYINIDELIAWFKSLKLEYPECAQLFYKDEHDDLFTCVAIVNEINSIRDNVVILQAEAAKNKKYSDKFLKSSRIIAKRLKEKEMKLNSMSVPEFLEWKENMQIEE